MSETHCHSCGGFITDTGNVSWPGLANLSGPSRGDRANAAAGN